MDVVQLLVTIIGGLAALLGYNWVKRRNAEALLQNVQVKQQENKLDQQVSTNQGQIQSEQQNQQQIQAQLKEQTSENLSNKQVADFFNNQPKP